MPTQSAQPHLIKILAAAALALVLCFAQTARAAENGSADYVVRPDSYRDNYILTQLFYSAFSVEDLEPMQRLVSRGMLAYPTDFPRFMALMLELNKKPDSRLFMLLAPLAPYVADSSRTPDLAGLIRLTAILSGQSLPGGGETEPSLASRIKFYEDDSRVVRRRADGTAESPAPPVPRQAESGGERPAYIAGSDESFNYLRMKGNGAGPYTELHWTRPGSGGQSLSSRAVDSTLPDGSVWGGVYTDFSGRSESELAFFIVRDGIIRFALPQGISEGDFYADEQARPHQTGDLDPALFAGRADGAMPRPCEMRVVISPRDDAMPPELTVRLEQSNPGRESSDFICRAQCVLTYGWDDGYRLSGKTCVQSGWGVWPYSEERIRERNSARTRRTP